MKVPMSRITVYGNKKDRKAVLEFLQRRQIVDISAPDKDNEEFGFAAMNTGDARSEFMREKSDGERALQILEEYAPQKEGLLSSLNGREPLTAEEYYKYVDIIPKTVSAAKKLIELSEQIAQRRGQITRCKSMIERLQPWLTLDVAMDSRGTDRTAGAVGVFSAGLTLEEITEKYYEEENVPPVYIELVSSVPQQTCVYVMAAKKHWPECERRLQQIGFAPPKSVYHGIPRKAEDEQRAEIKALEKEISAFIREIQDFGNRRGEIRFMVDYYEMRTEKYGVLSKLSQNKHIFVLSGFIPECRAKDLAAELEHEYNAAVELEPAGSDAPVLLKNGRLSEPVEGVIKTFALPSPSEIDPTSIMAVFYYVFFGMMLSDAGYGLLMTIGCAAVLHKFKNMEGSLRQSLKMFMYCGISTIFWGVLFGGYFGDAIQVISGTFFGTAVKIEPLWFEPVNDPIKMLMWSFLFGLIHLFTGLGIKLYQCVKQRDYMSAFADCICWFLLVGGGVVYLFRVEMFLSIVGIDTMLPAVFGNIAAIAAGIGAAGILFCSARGGGVVKRLLKGAYSLYGVTSWLSDLLSYSRLLALGLATGVIATVFNQMGSMAGGGIVGALVFIPVFLIGHALNIGVNLLGAYVHTNRLQFVEFFGKFYEGGGREFAPFSADTKYYKFK